MPEDRPDIQGLTEFAKTGSRERARFFVGRREEFLEIDDLCARVMDGFRCGWPVTGTTRVIQGAPGAGKTAMLHELEGRWKDTGATAPIAVRLQKTMLDDVDERITGAVAPELLEKLRQTREGRLRYGLNTVISMEHERGRSVRPVSASLHVLKELIPVNRWRTVCLMIDEIQNADSPMRGFLEDLHLNEVGLPVVPLYAGLGTSVHVLSRLGLSRLDESAVLNVGCLDTGDAAAAVRMMFDRYRVDQDDTQVDWPAYVAGISDGWPQHLHNGMRSLAQELVAAQGRLADVRVPRFLEREWAFRDTTYGYRMSDETVGAEDLIRKLMREMPPKGMHERDVSVFVRRHGRSPDDLDHAGWWIPEDMTPENFIRHLVHRGVLQDIGGRTYVCPIPSFRNWLSGEGDARIPSPPELPLLLPSSPAPSGEDGHGFTM